MSHEFVLAFVTIEGEEPTVIGGGSRFLMVRNCVRGWELPGGNPEDSESAEQTIFRELYEETGLSGTISGWNNDTYEKGLVAWIQVDSGSVESGTWNVEDAEICEAAWFTHPPIMATWDRSELDVLAEWVLKLHRDS